MNIRIKRLKQTDLLLASGIFCAAVLLFLPSVFFDVDIFDDYFYIRDLQTDDLPGVLEFIFTPVLKLRSPLVQLSFLADRVLWGKGLLSCGVHAGNIFYHAAGAVLLYFLCRKLRLRFSGKSLHLTPVWCAAAALIWALHPQRVESVAWISERKDVLLALCFFAALLLLIRFIRTGKGCFWPLGLYLLSFSIKPMLFMFPCAVLLLLKIETGRFFSRKNIRLLLPYVLICFAALLYLFPAAFSGNRGAGQLWGRSAIVLHNIGNYFQSAVLPGKLVPFYPMYHPAESTLLHTGLFALLLCLPLVVFRQQRELRNILFLTLLLFPVMLAPVCGFIRIGNADWADRYNLLPSCFLLLPAVFLLRKWSVSPHLRPVIMAGTAVYLLYLTVQTACYLPVWRSYKSVLTGSVENISRPNYRIVFLASFCAFIEKDYPLARDTTLTVKPEDAATPADRKCIALFRETMTGLLEMLSPHQERGGRRLTAVLLTDPQPTLAMIASGYLDVVTDAAVYWNLKHNKTQTAALLCRKAVPHTHFPDKKLVYQIKAALLEKDLHTAANTIRLLQKRFPQHVLLKDFERQLKTLTTTTDQKNEK